MKTRFTLLLVIMVTGFSAFGQFSDYKYIIVPTKFDAFRKENMHQTSTTVKYLLTQRGFNAVYDNAMPEELFQDRCLGLVVNLDDSSSLFSTKVALVFTDCRSVEIFRTIEGKSKLKEFKPAYRQAIDRASVSLDGIDPTYTGKSAQEKTSNEETLTLNFKNDVKSLEEKPKEVVLEQQSTVEDQTYKSIKPKPAPSEEVSVTNSSMEKSKEVILEQEATPENQVYKSIQVKPASQDGVVKEAQYDVLYAQPNQNGFQLVDSSPKIRYKLVETSVKDFYLVSEGDKSGLIFKKEGKWRIEYVENGVRKVEELNIKF